MLAGPFLLEGFEQKMISTGPNGSQTPASVGLAYEGARIPSGPRLLDAYIVPAATTCQPRVALLIFHGVGETISDWIGAQRLLHEQCISSLVFDYSGSGDSTGRATVKHLDEDVVSAYTFFVSRFADIGRRCVLGFSMGNAPMLESLSRFSPEPACMVVGSAFSSGRDSASLVGIPDFLFAILPDQWNNVRNVSGTHPPLLVVHSDADKVLPLWMGQRIFQAASEPKTFALVHGLRHNASYSDVALEWWGPVITFVRPSPQK
jgi:fermentation-respiration switch protein FrsA (DUF1100 family)